MRALAPVNKMSFQLLSGSPDLGAGPSVEPDPTACTRCGQVGVSRPDVLGEDDLFPLLVEKLWTVGQAKFVGDQRRFFWVKR